LECFVPGFLMPVRPVPLALGPSPSNRCTPAVVRDRPDDNVLDLFIPVRREPPAEIARAVRTARSLAQAPGVSVHIVCGMDDEPTLRQVAALLKHIDGVLLSEVVSCAPKARAMNEAVRRSSARWVGFLDVDVAVSPVDLMTALTAADRDRLDYLEFVELSSGPGAVTHLLNIQSVLFQMANAYLTHRVGSRYFASSGLLLRRSFLDSVGPWPEGTWEDGYWWSLLAAGHPQHGRTSSIPVHGRPAANLRQALRQRRRWYQGQLQAAIGCLRPGYPKRGRLLGLVGGVSLLAQAAWTASLALSPVSRRARRTFAALTMLEAARLTVAAPHLMSAPAGRGRGMGAFLAFELVEGLAVLSAALIPSPLRHGWQPTVRG
jgi:cellulose synthase/poly-beta-1,6-N-acetylglucosamine synthase-like glycosyltransferase